MNYRETERKISWSTIVDRQRFENDIIPVEQYSRRQENLKTTGIWYHRRQEACPGFNKELMNLSVQGNSLTGLSVGFPAPEKDEFRTVNGSAE